MNVLRVVSTVVLLFGLLEMPYPYYSLLRLVVCLTAAVGFVRARRRGNETWAWVFGVLAVLYNPLLPAQLGSRALWIPINIATLICLWTAPRKGIA